MLSERIEQADREAAELARAFCDDMDEPEMVILFANHAAPLRARIAELEAQVAKYWDAMQNTIAELEGTSNEQ